jgi:cytochrome c oxidase subunit 2
MLKLHHYIMAILVGIFTTVSYLMYTSLVEDLYSRNSTYHWTLKAILIIAPAVVFLFISFPSLSLFYVMDELMNPSITLKAIGNQWHLTYKYGDYTDMEVEFNFYMTSTPGLKTGDYRLREVDNRVPLPM